jgi:pyruvate/2-oxoglutarate/acetoin dehydrogenase E1 component
LSSEIVAEVAARRMFGSLKTPPRRLAETQIEKKFSEVIGRIWLEKWICVLKVKDLL